MDLLYMFKDSDMIVLGDNGMIGKRDTLHALWLKYLDGSNGVVFVLFFCGPWLNTIDFFFSVGQ